MTVAPFVRPFLSELHGQVAQYLPHADLQSYALASWAFNKEANRFLWRAVMVSPDVQRPPALEEFVRALKRDPVRASFIRHLSFVPEIDGPKFVAVRIFPKDLSDKFWTSLEEALRLVTRLQSIGLLTAPDACVRYWKDSQFSDRFTNIISNVFKSSRIQNFHAYLRPDRLFQLCQTWPSLITLRAERVSEDAFADLPPDALPQLRHLESDTRLMSHISPGRAIETWYHTGEWCNDFTDDFKLLTSTIRSCTTLQRVRVECRASSESDAGSYFPAFAHDTLRNFHLKVFFEAEAIGYDPKEGGFRLTPSLVMQALPSGALALFPKLEVLQIILSHHDFEFAADGDIETVANELASFLMLEGHGMLHQVDVDCSFYRHDDWTWGATRFRATRHDGRWNVEVVTCSGWKPSIVPKFDEFLVGH